MGKLKTVRINSDLYRAKIRLGEFKAVYSYVLNFGLTNFSIYLLIARYTCLLTIVYVSRGHFIIALNKVDTFVL